MKATIAKTFEFCAAHHLTGVPPSHSCSRMHGHTWKIVVELKGEVDPKTGFVMDFRELSEEVKPILEVLDHHTLNDVLENPTSENLAYYLFGHLRARLPKLNAIEVYESERSRCRVEA